MASEHTPPQKTFQRRLTVKARIATLGRDHMSVPEKAAPPPDQPTKPPKETYKVAFYTAPSFRAIQADGSWGRISPSGFIHLTFFNDCGTMPAFTIHDIGPDGTMSPDMKLKFGTDADIVRQLEVDVVLSLEAAKSVKDNLQNFINILEDLRKKVNPT